MYSVVTYLLVAGAGALLAWFLNRAPELRNGRLSQIVLVPGALMLALWFLESSGGQLDLSNGLAIIAIIVITAFMLAPSIAFNLGMGLSNFLDPMDWTPAEEELALRPIRRLIDREQYYQAIGDLDALLKIHKPTYEALLLRAKLLHHFGRVEDTAASLLQAIRLSHTTAQQLAVMELLAAIEDRHSSPPRALARDARRLRIAHELILFPPDAVSRSFYKTIPPGGYEVEETIRHRHRWLKLAGENWGNAETCWQAVLEVHHPAAAPPKQGFFWQITRLHQAVTMALQGKPRLRAQAEADRLLKEANQFIRQENWREAMPLLQQASASDPHRYEIAYRWVQAVRYTADDHATVEAVKKAIAQDHWSAAEQEMLQQLRHPIALKK